MFLQIMFWKIFKNPLLYNKVFLKNRKYQLCSHLIPSSPKANKDPKDHKHLEPPSISSSQIEATTIYLRILPPNILTLTIILIIKA